MSYRIITSLTFVILSLSIFILLLMANDMESQIAELSKENGAIMKFLDAQIIFDKHIIAEQGLKGGVIQ